MRDDNACSKPSDRTAISRRRLLALTAGGSVAGLAGCSGEGGNGTDDAAGGLTTASESTDSGSTEEGTTSSEGDSESSGNVWVTRTATVPTDITWNPYQDGGDWYTLSLIHGFGASLSRRKPLKWVPFLAENWSLDGKTFTIEMHDGFTWHNGNPVTADDYRLQYEISDHMGFGKHGAPLPSIDGYPEAVDDYTLEMTLKEEMSEATFVPQNFGEPLWYEPDFFTPFVEKFRDASGEEAMTGIRKEVSETALEEPVGFGPLKYDSVDSQKTVLKYFEDYPFEYVQQKFTERTGLDITGYGRPNFDTVHVKHVPSNNKMTQEIMSGNVDGGPGPLVSDQQLPEGMSIPQQPVLHGSGFIFNMYDWGETPGDPMFRKPDVRKAFAYAIDRHAAGVQLGQGAQDATTDATMTGLLQAQESEWLSDDFMSKMIPYERDLDKAAQHLEAAGLSKEDGTWYKPNGDKFTVRMGSGACVTRYVNAFSVLQSNLSEFGIDAKVINGECSTFFSKDDNDNGVDITTAEWGGAQQHPYFAFDWMYLRDYVTKENSAERDGFLPGDETLDVPPVGEPDGETSTFDPAAKVAELGTTTEKAEQTKIVEELAWATNYAVPKITCNENFITGALNSNGWKVPEADSLAASVHPFFSMIHHLGVVDAE